MPDRHRTWIEALIAMGPLAIAALLGVLASLVHAGKTFDWWMAVKAVFAGTVTATVTGGMLVEVFGWNVMVGQAVAFWLGMIAYRVTPLLLRGSEQVANAAPAILIERLRALWSKPAAAVPPADEEIKP